MTPSICLTIAAHDPLGGAGLAADLTTFAALGTHGTVAITAVTAQRLDSVEQVEAVPADLLAAQIDAVLADCGVAAVKVGLLLDPEQVEVIAERVADGALPRPVVDPVMVDGRGRRFVPTDVEAACRERLFPFTRVLTPNQAEAELLGGPVSTLGSLGAELVVVTGGRSGEATDLLVTADGSVSELSGSVIDTRNVRGSGCTFAAAVTAGLAKGRTPVDAAHDAKLFVADRLADSAAWSFGAGRAGPLSHRFAQGT